MKKNNIDFLTVQNTLTSDFYKDIESRILYEDNHLLIINKKAGEIVQGDKTGDISLVDKLKQYLKNKYNKQGNIFCGLVHRIDRPVSGAVIFAKTSKALSRMNELIKNHEIEKIYRVIVDNPLEKDEGLLEGYIWKNEFLNKSFYSTTSKPDYKTAKLKYKTINKSERYFLLEIKLLTGRHHQIRVQLSASGATVKGDLKYGAKRSNNDGSIALHAYMLLFKHPVSNNIVKVIADESINSSFAIFK